MEILDFAYDPKFKTNLTPYELVAENNPNMGTFLESSFGKRVKEFVINTLIVKTEELTDETVFGIEEVYEDFGRLAKYLPHKYREAYELYKQVKKMSKASAISHLYSIGEKISKKDYSFTEEEKIALLKMTRSPVKYLQEMKYFFRLGFRTGVNIYEKVGIVKGISPIYLARVIRNNKNSQISKENYRYFFFFTNHEWYKKEPVSSILLLYNLAPFKEKISSSLLELPQSYWKGIAKTMENNILFWKKRLLELKYGIPSFSSVISKPSAVELYAMSLVPELAFTEEYREVLEKALDREKYSSKKLLLQALKNLENRKEGVELPNRK